MIAVLQPFLELLNGQAYAPHPGDAALSLGRRFEGRALVVIGGGGTGGAWTQRVDFDREGLAKFSNPRSSAFKRGTAEWREHLARESRATSGWSLILIEQQWQAAASAISAASLGASGVEQMLRVRDAVADFGDDRISEDAVRVTIDHPTMEGGVVAGVRAAIIDALEQEAEGAGFQIAAVRISTLALFERYIARLQKQRGSLDRAIVIFDGQSALLVGVKEGAFEQGEGGVSYLVNRSVADVQAQLFKRITAPHSLREWHGQVVIVGSRFPWEADLSVEGLNLLHEDEDVVAAAVDDRVRHDLRSSLQEMRTALPRWSRKVIFGALAVIAISVVVSVLQVSAALRLEEKITAHRLESFRYRAAAATAEQRLNEVKQEESSVRQTSEWIQRNYHAQELVQSFINALPAEVALDGLSIQATEGLPQARLRFTLFGSEDVQRASLREIEGHLYHLGYEIGRRDDPTSASGHRGGIVYSWDLIMPAFGA